MDDQDGDAQPKPVQGRRTPVWTIVVAVLLGAALIVTFVVGIALTATGGQTPNESYTLTILLTLLSISAGGIITLILQQHQNFDQKRQEEQAKERTEQIARSAVVRVFRSLSGLGRIQELVAGREGCAAADLRNRMGQVDEVAKLVFENTGDSITDWKRFAPDAVADELKRAEVPHQLKGAPIPVPKSGEKQEKVNAE